tara:strand:- start:13 stop:483 length:471 start_codon:yes stop_codon:yes gene_type:complete
MNLYIQIENGQPVNHPAAEDNLIAAFRGVPDNWEPFVRVERPAPGVYEVLESEEPEYQYVDGVWTDVWSVRPMTAEEKEVVKQRFIAAWALRPDAFNFTAWVFDEENQIMVPPFPKPVEEGKLFAWSGADNNWKEGPAKPEGPHVFDYTQWVWVSV